MCEYGRDDSLFVSPCMSRVLHAPLGTILRFPITNLLATALAIPEAQGFNAAAKSVIVTKPRNLVTNVVTLPVPPPAIFGSKKI